MTLIWATRGRTWGFQFLRNGGFKDPLPVYDSVFAGIDDELEVCHRVDGKVALRFQDPLERTDRAGRVIPHEFVVIGPEADGIGSVEDGFRLVWHQVADTFETAYGQSHPPTLTID